MNIVIVTCAFTFKRYLNRRCDFIFQDAYYSTHFHPTSNAEKINHQLYLCSQEHSLTYWTWNVTNKMDWVGKSSMGFFPCCSFFFFFFLNSSPKPREHYRTCGITAREAQINTRSCWAQLQPAATSATPHVPTCLSSSQALCTKELVVRVQQSED